MTSERLILEPLGPHHAPLLYAAVQAPALYTYIPDEPPTSVDALAARYHRYATAAPPGEIWRNWVMRRTVDSVPVGTLQATITGDHALIAYAVFPDHWRQGYARDGVGQLLALLADEHRVVRAEATIDVRNAASIALVESLGFARVDTALGAAELRGRASDEHHYARSLVP